MDKYYTLFLLFMLYSIFGWLVEVTGKIVIEHKWMNRGFLIGPYCPIYGFGGLFITLLLDKYKNNVLILFFMSIIICSILEYLTSYFMEKIFKTRWWDYSRYKFNINGRICLETMVVFGILGCLGVLVLNPFFRHLISYIPSTVLPVVSFVICFIFIFDFIVSTSIIFSFRNTIRNVEKDATEEITKKVRNVFLHKDFLHRRLIKAYPNMKSRKERLIEIRNRVNRELERLELYYKRKKK